MEHVHVETGELRLLPGSTLQRRLYSRHQGPSGVPRIGAFQLDPGSQREHGLLNTTVELRGRHPLFLSPGVRSLAEIAWAAGERQWPPKLARHLLGAAGEPGKVLTAAARRTRSSKGMEGPASSLVITAEQAPNPRSRVTLDSRKDRLGVPRPHVHWAALRLDLENIRGTQDVLDRQLREAGQGIVVGKWGDADPLPYLHGCRHHIGTTRMSDDASTGVVDWDCRVHGTTNLYMAGSSVMPTAGAVTVTLTAIALAMRLGAHLAAELGGHQRSAALTSDGPSEHLEIRASGKVTDP
jgi:choline dehydrogenase-like flavoprotein